MKIKKMSLFGKLGISCLTLLTFVFSSLSLVSAQDVIAPRSNSELKLSFSSVVKKTAPSVVNVYGARMQRNRRPPFMDDFFSDFFRGPGGLVPKERIQRSLGSGVVVGKDMVVTNNHVIEGMTDVKISFADKREFNAEIILKDSRSDLAVLKVKGLSNVTPINFADSDKLEVGDIVLAIGNPFGVGQTVTQGIVSAVARTQIGVSDYRFFIQTDAAINPGNSGGALVDVDGNLVGINTAIYSRSGGSIGLGFAIPSSMVKMIVESANSGSRYVKRPWLGARLQTVTSEMAEALGLSQPSGVMVTTVIPQSPADEAGLKRGDMIMSVEGIDIEDPDAFSYRFALRGIGGTTKLSVLREGKPLTLNVKLMTPAETRPRDTFTIEIRSPLSGAKITNFSPAVAEEMQVDIYDIKDAVIIEDIVDGSAAQRFGFQRGDIILAINKSKIEKTADVRDALAQKNKFLEITIDRGGRIISSILSGG